MPGRRQSGKSRMQGSEKAAEVTLFAEQLGNKVTNMRDLHSRFEIDDIECGVDGVPESVEYLDPVTRPVLGKIGLVSTQ